MTVYSKYNAIYRLQRWLDSVPGQTFMNYAYSWGAAIVILGTLFKLTHLPGANFMLYLGMGTEVLVFFISAFDRPFDKTSIGKDLPTHLEDEDADSATAEASADSAEGQTISIQGGTGGTGGTIIIGGGGSMGDGNFGGTGQMGEGNIGQGGAGGAFVGGIIGGQGGTLPSEEAVASMEEAQTNYTEQLNKLTEMLTKVAEQSERLTSNSEEMENLNRTLTGISRVYEMQLKSASRQIGTIEEINDQTRHMAEQIADLNKIYARMIEAMTVNMRATGAVPQ